MNKLKVVIVEDEPLATELIKEYIDKIPSLSFIQSFYDPKVALQFIKVHSIDVIFLDIHLPQMTGLEFIKNLPYKTQIILTTAYHQYALESYEYHVIDYLLKPIEFDRFQIAVTKLTYPNQDAFIHINVNKLFVKINLKNILYLESKRDYLHIFTLDGSHYKTKKTLKETLNILPNNFIKIHRSFIVNEEYITSYSAKYVTINQIQLPIGRKFGYPKK